MLMDGTISGISTHAPLIRIFDTRPARDLMKKKNNLSFLPVFFRIINGEIRNVQRVIFKRWIKTASV